MTVVTLGVGPCMRFISAKFVRATEGVSIVSTIWRRRSGICQRAAVNLEWCNLD